MEERELLIELEDVSIHTTGSNKRYYKNNIILSDVNLEIGAGELVYLIGKVGSGKSTLLKSLYAEYPISQGWGRVGDFELTSLRKRDIPMLRRSLGLVFQDFQLLPDRSVYENLKFFLKAIGWKNLSAINRRIDEVLTKTSLRGKAHHMPYQLSGGEQQRLAIGRALLNNQEIILADEPTANLDPRSSDEIMELFTEIVEMGCTVIIATHNIQIIEEYPGRVLLCKNSTINEIDIDTIIG